MTLTFHLTLEVPSSAFKFSGFSSNSSISFIARTKELFPFMEEVKVLSTFLRPVPIETRQEIDEGHTYHTLPSYKFLPPYLSFGSQKRVKKIYIYWSEGGTCTWFYRINHPYMCINTCINMYGSRFMWLGLREIEISPLKWMIRDNTVLFMRFSCLVKQYVYI